MKTGKSSTPRGHLDEMHKSIKALQLVANGTDRPQQFCCHPAEQPPYGTVT